MWWCGSMSWEWRVCCVCCAEYTCYTLHKLQERVAIHIVLIMQLCQSELLNDVELVDTWLATRDPVRAHRLSLNQVDIHHCQGRYCFVVTLTSPDARWGKRKWSRSLYSDRYEKLRHVGKVPNVTNTAVFLGEIAMEIHQRGFMSAVLEWFGPYHKETVSFEIFWLRNPDLGQKKCELFHSSLP
jgi:hypothetical protein